MQALRRRRRRRSLSIRCRFVEVVVVEAIIKVLSAAAAAVLTDTNSSQPGGAAFCRLRLSATAAVAGLGRRPKTGTIPRVDDVMVESPGRPEGIGGDGGGSALTVAVADACRVLRCCSHDVCRGPNNNNGVRTATTALSRCTLSHTHTSRYSVSFFFFWPVDPMVTMMSTQSRPLTRTVHLHERRRLSTHSN